MDVFNPIQSLLTRKRIVTLFVDVAIIMMIQIGILKKKNSWTMKAMALGATMLDLTVRKLCAKFTMVII